MSGIDQGMDAYPAVLQLPMIRVIMHILTFFKATQHAACMYTGIRGGEIRF